MTGTRELTEREVGVLSVERRQWRFAGAKEQAIRDELGLSATRYYQVLAAMLDDEAVIATDPVLVARLRRQRDRKAIARAQRQEPAQSS